MVDAWVPVLTAVVGALGGWIAKRADYRRQREDSAKDRVDRQKASRDIIRARSVPELLDTLQSSIDFVSRFSEAKPDDDSRAGYMTSWLEEHDKIKRRLNPAVANHPIHSVLESIQDQWKQYFEQYDTILTVTWDELGDDRFPTLVEKDPNAVSRTLVLAGELRATLQAASRRADDARAAVEAASR